MAELEHVVSVIVGKWSVNILLGGTRPERDDDELRILRPVFDVVRNNGYVAEV